MEKGARQSRLGVRGHSPVAIAWTQWCNVAPPLEGVTPRVGHHAAYGLPQTLGLNNGTGYFSRAELGVEQLVWIGDGDEREGLPVLS